MNTEPVRPARMQVLGGGPAGLAAAYYARKEGRDIVLLEGADAVGGNARTLKLGDCLFDTGAHRLHDKDAEVTRDLKSLMGEDLLRVNAPSEIHLAGRHFRFPLHPRDLMRGLAWPVLARIVFEQIRGSTGLQGDNFRDWAVRQYGRTLSELLLLNYSEKLWGEKTERLSPKIGGGRLKNLDLRAFFRSLFPGDDGRHLDGPFYYPKYGFGSIFERVAKRIGPGVIHCRKRVTRLEHEGGLVRTLELNGSERVAAGQVISSLPLNLTIEILRPRPDASLMRAARSIRFRKLILCVFCLKRDRFSGNASIYYPSPEIPFTRLYECKNRSPHVAPAGRTAIVLELPCHATDALWGMEEGRLLRETFDAFRQVERVGEEELVASAVFRLPFAYPILEVGYERTVSQLLDYLAGFQNLHILGRNAHFRYLHTHDLFRSAKDLMDRIE